MDNIGDRIKQFIDFKRLSVMGFEREIGAGNNTIGTSIKRNSNFSSSLLSKILIKYSEINPEWLLTGKGSMLKEASPNLVSEPQASYLNPNQNLDRELDLLKTQLKDKERIISMLEKEVLRLENELKKFTL